MNILGNLWNLVLNLLEGWQNAGLDHCTRTLSQHSSVQHNYYAALMLELQPIQINLNGGIKNHASKISKWSSGCRAILLLICCSQASLANSFKEQQTHALDDYIETSVMLQYNKRH